MITEDDLRRLLADAAESVPPPGRAPDALLAAVADQTAVKPARRRPPRLKPAAVAAVAAVALVVVAVGGALVMSDPPSPRFTETGAPIAPADEAATGDKDTSHELGELESDRKRTASQFDSLTADATPSTPAAPNQPLADTAKVIRTGSLDLEVRKGAFEGTVARITAQAIGLGGYVAESTTSEAGDAPSGSVVVRVPDESFDELLADLRELGEVKAVASKGTDVTAQFTDLQARLTALQATRDRLGTVLSEAANVPDILAVQDRITQVQTEIEQIQGQQRLLDDQTSMGTLAVTLGEPGAEIVKIDATPDEGLGAAWDDARRRFGNGLEDLVSWSGSAAVVLIVGLVLLVLSRLAWVAGRRRLV